MPDACAIVFGVDPGRVGKSCVAVPFGFWAGVSRWARLVSLCLGNWWAACHVGCVGCSCVVGICGERVMSGHVVSRHVTSCHVVSCCVVSGRVVSGRVESCHAMSCHVVLGHLMLLPRVLEKSR